ncbi:MAG TPA: hypothetical protein VMU47_06750 [Caldimonas sp.]|nr:hypothetical protein [Caldimonas sp.]
MAKVNEPIEEFFIVASKDVSGDIDDLKDTCGWYASSDDALSEAAVTANPGDDGEGFPQVVYRVQKFVEVL